MTALEMKYKFDIKMRELLRSLNHPFTTHEVNRLLNESQLEFVKEYSKFFEKDEEVRRTLDALVKPFTITTFTHTTDCHDNGYFVTMPTDMIKVVEESVNSTVRVKPEYLDGYTVNVANPFKMPSTNLVWRLNRDDKHELVTDGVLTLTTYTGSYIQEPPDIDIDNAVNSVLPHSVHEEVIEGAIRIAIRILQRNGLLKTDSKQ